MFSRKCIFIFYIPCFSPYISISLFQMVSPSYCIHLFTSLSVFYLSSFLPLSLSQMHTHSLCSLSLSSRSDISHTSAWLGRAMTGQRGEVIEFLSQSDSHQHRQFRHSQARRNRQGGHCFGLEPQLTTGGHRRLKPEEETGGNKCDGTCFNFTVHVFMVLKLICHQSSCSSSERESEGAVPILFRSRSVGRKMLPHWKHKDATTNFQLTKPQSS